MATNRSRGGSSGGSRSSAKRSSGPSITLPLIHTAVPVPNREQAAYFAAIGALVAFDLLEWPVAAVVATGHALATRSRNRAVRGAAQGAEAA